MKTILISTLALAAATPALAQSDPSISVQEGLRTTDEIVVTATLSGDGVSTSLLGSSVTVIDSEALEQRQTRVLSDVLRDVPGVSVSRSGAVGAPTQIRIRGSEANHVLVFIDGIKASDPYQGEYDFGNLIADEAARVEVLRGQQSALYGSDAIGGVISYTTLTGRDAPGYSARIEGGSLGTVAAAARAAGTSGEQADYALSASYLTTDGYSTARTGSRDLGSNSIGTSFKFNWTPSPIFKLTAVGRYSHTRADLNDQGIDSSSPIVNGYQVVSIIDTPGSYYENDAFYGLARAELNFFDGAWTNALSGQITDANRNAYDLDGYSFGDRGRRYRGNFESVVRFGSDRVRNRFTLAATFEREEARNIDPTGFGFAGTTRSDTTGYVAQYELTVDERLAIGASARIDDFTRFDDAATYRATASYLLPSGTRVHAAYGTGIKAPTLTELFGFSDGIYIGNPDLRPERSTGWEAGVEQSFFDRQAKVGATYFDNRFRDQIEQSFAVVNGEFLTTSSNSDFAADQKGVEAYGNVRLGAVRVDAAYTYLDAPQTVLVLAGPQPAGGAFQAAVPVETQAVRRPENAASLNVTYAPQALPISLTATVRYNGAMRDYAFNADFQRILVDLDDFVLVNLNASFDVSDRFQLFGRVENLFDEKYEEVFTYRTAGLTAFGGIRARF